MARSVEVIIGARTKMACPPEVVYGVVTDARNASMIPGSRGGRLICGEDRQPGSRYECEGNLYGVAARIQFETTQAKPPNFVKARLITAEFDEFELGGILGRIIGGIIARGVRLEDGAAKWSFLEREYGCRAIFTTIIKFGGPIVFLPRVKEVLKEMVIKETDIMVKNVKIGAEYHYASIL